ncbi:hypothetical protein ACFYUO_20650, partial [Bacillus velezensis]
MGFKYYDKKTEQYVPMSIELLKSDGVSFTAPEIKKAFDTASQDITNVISTVDSSLTDIKNTIGDISKIPASG